MSIEEITKMIKDDIDGTPNMTIGEFKNYIEGVLAGIYICLDYDTYEKILKEIQDYVDEKYDIFIS